VVRWEQRVEKMRVPIQFRELAPERTALSEGRVVRSARSSATGTVAAQPTITRDSIRSAARSTSPGTNDARTIVLPMEQFGGISQLESDQPRYGTRPEYNSQPVVR